VAPPSSKLASAALACPSSAAGQFQIPSSIALLQSFPRKRESKRWPPASAGVTVGKATLEFKLTHYSLILALDEESLRRAKPLTYSRSPSPSRCG
jgi:hypothetical protein